MTDKLEMTLYKKIFLLVSIVIATSFLVIGLTLYESVSALALDQYVDRYKKINVFISQTLLQLERFTESTARNALTYLYDIESRRGLLSHDELKELANRLNVTHFYITDHTGRFVRDTFIEGGRPNLNLFNFCDDYRKLLTGDSNVEQTPIIPIEPYYGPFKFIMIANEAKTRILEVGMHLDFIAKTLKGVMNGDREIVSLGLYAPSGLNLGYLSQSGRFDFNTPKLALNEIADKVTIDETNKLATITTLAPASYKACCECKTKGVTQKGEEYFYVLRTTTSLNSYFLSVEKLRNVLFISIFFGFFIAILMARWLSKNLTRRITNISKVANEIIATGDLKERVTVTGKDEISHLAANFNRMITSLAYSRDRLLETERARHMNQLATQVAHDIRSPVSAIQIALEHPDSKQEETRVLMKAALKRIKDISNNLLSAYKDPKSKKNVSKDCCHLPFIIESILMEKSVQLNYEFPINVEMGRDKLNYFSVFSSAELKSIISNLIDNSIQANKKNKPIVIKLSNSDVRATIDIIDEGVGMDLDRLNKVKRGEPVQGSTGHGLGLSSAMRVVRSYGGELEIDSKEGRGTRVSLHLTRCQSPPWFLNELRLKRYCNVVVIDDDPSVHEIWKQKFKNRNVNLYNFFTIEEEVDIFRMVGQSENHIVLCDYEFLNSQKNGIELLSKLKAENKSVLVTHHYEDVSIQRECEEKGIHLLSKLLVRRIDITIE